MEEDSKPLVREVPYDIIVNNKHSAWPHKVSFVRELHPCPRKRPGMEFRSSLIWFSHSSVRRTYCVPFITKSGKLSIHSLYVWKAHPEQIFFSMVSTVYRRLLRIISKRNFKSISASFCHSIMKVAIVYMLHKSDNIIDRFLGMARPGTPMKAVNGYAHFCVTALDENKRFVYSQAWYQAYWLKFLGRRPRDKSRYKVDMGSHLRNNFLDVTDICDDEKRLAFENSLDFFNCTPLRKFEKRVPLSRRESSGSLPSLSESLKDEITKDLETLTNWSW